MNESKLLAIVEYLKQRMILLLILVTVGIGTNLDVAANIGKISAGGNSINSEGAQTSAFLFILSNQPYIASQSLRLKGGVVPGKDGTMSFYDGTTLLGKATLKLELNGSMQAEFFTPGLTEGPHTLTTVYDGDGTVSPAQSVFIVSRATSVSSANYRGESLAPDQITATFGTHLAGSEAAADGLPLPTTLAGTTVKVINTIGATWDAPLLYVSPGQVNHLLPAVPGPATIIITASDGTTSATTVEITAVAPGVFAADSSGKGLAAAQVLRVKADGSIRYEPVAEFDRISGKFNPVPIDFGADGDQLFLILYGTGFRHRSSLAAVTATIGGVNVEVLYAGAQGRLEGLDQANLRLPSSLAGRGEVDVVLTADGKQANTVRVSIK